MGLGRLGEFRLDLEMSFLNDTMRSFSPLAVSHLVSDLVWWKGCVELFYDIALLLEPEFVVNRCFFPDSSLRYQTF